MKRLVEHGCQDITGDLNLGGCSPHMVASGGFGNVYLAKSWDGVKLAVKCLSNLRYLDSSDNSSKLLKHTAREIYAWSKFNHPGVLPLRGIALFRGQIAMVSEWVPNGTLASYLRKGPSFDKIQLCIQAAEALEYMHARGIVHGDIKTANVLMSNDNAPLFMDFGSALVTHNPSVVFSTTSSFGFTFRYAPPEVLKNHPRSTFEADVYMFGMMVFEVLAGKVPFAGMETIAVLYAVGVKKEIPERPDISSLFRNKTLEDGLWDLLTHCWNYEPKERPSASELKKRRLNNDSELNVAA
ncbi:hypothetical protein FRC12_017582 [Ceratobasidium sp. 428]|nr:hypothetical protein FRC12_017582 [Ceratobasidium sp. 428]